MQSYDAIQTFIMEYDLPVSRGGQPVGEFLADYYVQYLSDLKAALAQPAGTAREALRDALCAELGTIERLSADILHILRHYAAGRMRDVYEEFAGMMTRVEPFLLLRSYTRGAVTNRFYRVRAGNQMFDERGELFHIPMSKRSAIKQYRYSIPGHPCLYLSTSVELGWFECGTPKEFNYAQFFMDIPRDGRIDLIDFAHSPIPFAKSLPSQYRNHPQDAAGIDRQVLNSIVSFPLRAACSLSAPNREASFIEEYIFPQLLLLWVRSEAKYDGIAYLTNSYIECAKFWEGFNIVMPARRLTGDYCEYLGGLFEVTRPVKVEIREIARRNAGQIASVKRFLRDLEHRQRFGHSLEAYELLISVCKTMILLQRMLENDDYKNAEPIYQTLTILSSMSRVLGDEARENLIQKSAAAGAKKYPDAPQQALREEMSEVFARFRAEVDPAAFIATFFVDQIDSVFPVDPSTRRHIAPETPGRTLA